MTALRWFGALLAFYGPYLSVAIFLADPRARSRWRRGRCIPAWLSVRILAWLSAAAPASAAVLTWANLRGHAIGAERRRRASACAQGAVGARPCAPRSLVGVAMLRYSFGRRGSRAARRPDGGVRVSVDPGRRSGCAGPAKLPVPAARRAESGARRSRQAPRVRLILHRRRVARIHPPARRRRPVAELRQAARSRRRDRSRHAPADAGRAGLVGGRHGQVPAEERRPIRVRVPRATTTRRIRSICCRTTALRRRCLYQGFVRAEPLTRAVAARAPDLGHPRRLRRRRRASSTGRSRAPRSIERGYVLSDDFDEAHELAASVRRSAVPAIRRPPSTSRVRCSIAGRRVPWQDVLPPAGARRAAARHPSASRWDRAYRGVRGRARRGCSPRG